MIKWLNEESNTNTTTKGYTYGNSFQTNTSEQDSYDNALDVSAQNTYEKSNTKSITLSK